MEKNKKDPLGKKVKLKHIYPEDLKSYFITNLIVQHETDYFILSFFESFSPPILGETEQDKIAQLERIEHIDAKCVSRLIITPEKMRDIVKVLTENLKIYDKKMVSKSELLEES